ncbi:MAG: phosphatidate cytidylyltransferase [Desulfobacteraceae bacterium]|nr:phosphatidate cytidylyltransferase [Desulfobacteraceae bacterium]MBC2754538.1 phosphatidate cytidylyltransferase [Desulfobacteraceae bacterium]MBC2763797.1 phosphatidate cytidylyltransferase [ANME-2 cluster archaeon]
MHLKRIITAIVAFPLLSLFIWKGPVLLFTFFIGLVSLVALYEYYRIVFYDKKHAVFSSISMWGALIGLLIIGAAYNNSFQLIIGLLVFNFMGAAVLSMPQYKNGPGILNVVEKEIQAVIYIPLSLSMIVLLRNDPYGVHWIFFLLFIVFAGDVGAFYAGKFFGRHKLSPSISPGKTIEGSIGGMIFCIIIGYVFMRLFLPHLNGPMIFLLFAIVNICSQTGDLFESQLKRVGKIKDSGNILPGHGGILDRIDALLFAAPVTYFFKEFVLTGI